MKTGEPAEQAVSEFVDWVKSTKSSSSAADEKAEEILAHCDPSVRDEVSGLFETVSFLNLASRSLIRPEDREKMLLLMQPQTIEELLEDVEAGLDETTMSKLRQEVDLVDASSQVISSAEVRRLYEDMLDGELTEEQRRSMVSRFLKKTMESRCNKTDPTTSSGTGE